MGMKDPHIAVAQMRENCARWMTTLTPFLGTAAHGRDFVPVCGGPSLRSRIKEVRARQFIGGCIVACNGANLLLRQHGIIPDAVAFVDPSPAVLGFIDEEPSPSVYLVASICHPSVFEKLEGRNVHMWHPDILEPQTAQILDCFPDVPSVQIGGGNTIGLRMLSLGYARGFRTFHFYGLDSSFAEDGTDHAYVKHDGPETGIVRHARFNGKDYAGSGWMLQQAGEFMEDWYPRFTEMGCTIHVRGEGLIPDMCRALRENKRAA